jgi:hypothetical protein
MIKLTIGKKGIGRFSVDEIKGLPKFLKEDLGHSFEVAIEAKLKGHTTTPIPKRELDIRADNVRSRPDVQKLVHRMTKKGYVVVKISETDDPYESFTAERARELEWGPWGDRR